MATFPFELVSPEKLLFSGAVDSVVIPGVEGEMTILAQHAPVMTNLKPGIVTVTAGGTANRLFVRGGFADVAETGLTILAERAAPLAEFDAAKVSAEIRDAEDDIAGASNEDDRRRAKEQLDQLNELKAALAI